MDQIKKYFPFLEPQQLEQVHALKPLYEEWNAKINVISRKDMDNFFAHHVLHALGIAKFIQFDKGDKILDIGTGGGFPGIPLAIAFPEAKFHLIDSIGKKIKVVQGVSETLGLKNVSFEQCRAEKHNKKYDYIVSRAVTEFRRLASWSRNNFKPPTEEALPPGWICLKGGDLKDEFSGLRDVHIEKLSHYYEEDFFEQKKLVYVPFYAFKKQ